VTGLGERAGEEAWHVDVVVARDDLELLKLAINEKSWRLSHACHTRTRTYSLMG
jgi:hypothetical protein